MGNVTPDQTREKDARIRDLEARTAELEAGQRASEQRFSAIHDAVPFAIALTKMPEGVIVSVNDAFLKLFEYDRRDVVGKTSVELGIADAESRAGVAAALATQGAVRDLEVTRVTKSGDRRVLSLNVDRVTFGGRDHVITTIQDVTKRKRAERALEAANERLVEEDRHKGEFLAVLSHELRNPLAAIQNGLGLLERVPAESEQAHRAHAVIQRQVAQLRRLVDDLLDVTRVARSKIRLEREVLDIGEVARRTVEDYRRLFQDKGVELQIALAPGVRVNGDRTRLTQVLANLLQNASKFTETGGRVALSVSIDAAEPMAVIRVSDTGVGIPPELLGRLFEPFAQAQAKVDRSPGGLGLGLSLVKGIVELHGGEVSAQSEGPGRGATLTVRLPLATEDPVALTESEADAAREDRRVLIIDDDVDVADTLKDLLVAIGRNKVDVAYDAKVGLAKAAAHHPDMVLCDIGLPGMDGYEIARALRADPELKTTYLVALTGYALPEDFRRTSRAGFDRHVAKPATVETLEQLIAEVPRTGPSGA